MSNQFSGKPTKFCLILPTLAMVNMNYYPRLEDTQSIHVGWIALKILHGNSSWKSNCTWGGAHETQCTDNIAFHLWYEDNMPHWKANTFITLLLDLQQKAIKGLFLWELNAVRSEFNSLLYSISLSLVHCSSGTQNWNHKITWTYWFLHSCCIDKCVNNIKYLKQLCYCYLIA